MEYVIKMMTSNENIKMIEPAEKFYTSAGIMMNQFMKSM